MATKVVVMRGLPGSGKSTHVRETYPGAHVFSADDWFVGLDGVYRHDHTKLPQAHQSCFRSFMHFLQDELAEGVLVVDNTNVHAWEIAPYILAAESYGSTVEIVEIQCDPLVAASRNVHGVPEGNILRMSEEMAKETEGLPPWWDRTVISR